MKNAYRDLFRKLHNIRELTHPSRSNVYDQFKDLWVEFMDDCVRGMFCSYVNKNGYPLSSEIINSSPYFRRPSNEKHLINSIKEEKNIFIIGCEGSGKSTLCHYAIGHLAKHCLNSIHVFYLNANNFPDDESDKTLSDCFFNELSTLVYQYLTKKGLEEKKI